MSPSPSSVSMSLHPVVARCNSYTSIVHQEKEFSHQHQNNLHSLVQCLVEWLVVLQKLEEERKTDLPPVSCRCNKAVRINEELKIVGRGLSDVTMLGDRLGGAGDSRVQNHQLETISQDIGKLAGLLRADVSILIPSTIGRAEPSVAEQARNIVAETDCVRSLVSETVEAVTKLVYSLLSVDCCPQCSGSGNSGDEENDAPAEMMEDQDIDPDIMNMVAAMCGDYSNLPDVSNDNSSKSNQELQEIGRQVLERSRKRKQSRPNKFQAPVLPLNSKNSGLGSPTKKIRKVGDVDHATNPTEILFLLEKKKKLVKKDGLYKFVLWREALREEKNKVCLSS